MRIMDYYCFKGIKEYYIEKHLFEEKIEEYKKEKINRNVIKKGNNNDDEIIKIKKINKMIKIVV